MHKELKSKGKHRMLWRDYQAAKAQKRSLEKALKKCRISKDAFNLRVRELDKQIQIKLKDEGFPNPNVRDGHLVISLNCPCGRKGIVTCGKMDFKLLGKDKKGFIYFECPACNKHLQYDSLTGNTRIRKGILGFLFGRFS